MHSTSQIFIFKQRKLIQRSALSILITLQYYSDHDLLKQSIKASQGHHKNQVLTDNPTD